MVRTLLGFFAYFALACAASAATIRLSVSDASAAVLRLFNPYGELVDRGTTFAEYVDSFTERFDCARGSEIESFNRAITISIRRLPATSPDPACSYFRIQDPLGELAAGWWTVKLRILDSSGTIVVGGAEREFFVHARGSTCNRDPTYQSTISVFHRTLNSVELAERIRTDSAYAARLGSPTSVVAVGLREIGGVALSYPLLTNPLEMRALLEETGEFRQVLVSGSPYGCLGVPPPNQLGEMIEFHHAGLDHYFYTADAGEIGGLDSGTGARGWMRTGKSFRVILGGCVPAEQIDFRVFRFFGKPGVGPSSHVFTLDRQECRIIDKSGAWLYEGSTFWATRPDSKGGCPVFDEIPLFRVWKAFGDSNHRFTTDPAVVDEMKAKGWVDEGVAMCVKK